MPEPNNEGVDLSNEDIKKTTTPVASAVRTPIVVDSSIDVELPAVTFMYGTQTGTCQDYANQLAKQARSFGFKNATLCPMDKWKLLKEGKYTGPKNDSKSSELVVIITATYK